jgi:hypothetical protein
MSNGDGSEADCKASLRNFEEFLLSPVEENENAD